MLRDKGLVWGQKVIEKGLWILAPFSFFYALGVFVRNWAFDRGLFPIAKVKPVVVSIGNITCGGTGKTPFVHLLAKQFPHRKIAVLTRGYQDEASLHERRGLQVYSGKNRVNLAKQLDVDLIILDDGFQYRKLARDFEIVLMREQKMRYLPWGFLRDSPKRLKNADAVFTLGEQMHLNAEKILDLKEKEIPSIQGWKAALFCGIANPQGFKKTVEGLGALVESMTVFADHGHIDLTKLPQAEAYICTEKDFVKLPQTELPIYYLKMQMEISSPSWEKLIAKIDQKIDNNLTYE